MDCSTPGFPVHHQLPEPVQTQVHWVCDAIQPSHPLLSHLLLPSIFPSIRVFSSESVLCISWPKYWSFSFSMSPFNEYSGLISFRIDWSDLLAVFCIGVQPINKPCCDIFRWTAKGHSHTYTRIPSLPRSLPSRRPHNIEQSSLCYTGNYTGSLLVIHAIAFLRPFF